MNLILKGRGVELNDRLRGYATEKLTRSQRFFERIIKMEVELSQERNPRVKDRHKVEVTVKTPRETLRAHGSGGDYFSAIDQAADRLETQVKKAKARLNHRGHRGDGPPVPDVQDTETEEAGEGGEAAVGVRSAQALVKPMLPEEAILELETRGLQFLLFTDAETMDASVVYRRTDGRYGLIEHRR